MHAERKLVTRTNFGYWQFPFDQNAGAAAEAKSTGFTDSSSAAVRSTQSRRYILACFQIVQMVTPNLRSCKQSEILLDALAKP